MRLGSYLKGFVIHREYSDSTDYFSKTVAVQFRAPSNCSRLLAIQYSDTMLGGLLSSTEYCQEQEARCSGLFCGLSLNVLSSSCVDFNLGCFP